MAKRQQRKLWEDENPLTLNGREGSSPSAPILNCFFSYITKLAL
ncbi:hypothetical protein [Leptothoe sp. PORK10 BA2]|nr:hypothetical protein [Leptothoe sp. PORK10 BA2]MEA5462463.1 hypothetical protein [Leptothoe sp. PORK10 BA2]